MGFTTSYWQKERWSRRAADTLTSYGRCWNSSLGNREVNRRSAWNTSRQNYPSLLCSIEFSLKRRVVERHPFGECSGRRNLKAVPASPCGLRSSTRPSFLAYDDAAMNSKNFNRRDFAKKVAGLAGLATAAASTAAAATPFSRPRPGSNILGASRGAGGPAASK